MDIQKKYITIQELKVYQLSRELSSRVREIYGKLNFAEKKIFGVLPDTDYNFLIEKFKKLEIKLNNFISTTLKSIEK